MLTVLATICNSASLLGQFPKFNRFLSLEHSLKQLTDYGKVSNKNKQKIVEFSTKGRGSVMGRFSTKKQK